MKRSQEISKKIKMLTKYQTTGKFDTYKGSSGSSSSSSELSYGSFDENESNNNVSTGFNIYNMSTPNIYKNYNTNNESENYQDSKRRKENLNYSDKEEDEDKKNDTDNNNKEIININTNKTDNKRECQATPIIRKKISLFSFDEPENKNNNNEPNKINFLYKKDYTNANNKYILRTVDDGVPSHKKNRTEVNIMDLEEIEKDIKTIGEVGGVDLDEMDDDNPNLDKDDFFQKRKFTRTNLKIGQLKASNIEKPKKKIFNFLERKKVIKENKPKILRDLKELWSYNKILLNEGSLDFSSKKKIFLKILLKLLFYLYI